MKVNKNIKWLLLLMVVLVYGVQPLYAQGGAYLGYSGKLKWLRVNSLHTYFSEQGAESETAGDNARNIRFSWPGEYGLVQTTMRANGMWLGCKDYYEAKIDKKFSYMVTNAGLKPAEYIERPVFDAVEFKLVGRFDHPLVSVDDEIATHNSLYDELDEVDEHLIADRMVLVKNHTNIGVTVTKKVYAFTQQYHNNYYIYDYVLKNTGIIDNKGTLNSQDIKDFWFYLLYRYALVGEALYDDETGTRQGWGIDNMGWGLNVVHDVVGTDPTAPDFEFRAHYAWYGPHSGRPLNLEDDWGCPNQLEDGVMAAARYVGAVTIHADKSPQDPSDDVYQPKTTHYVNSDVDIIGRVPSQSWYDESFMKRRYETMSMGHATRTQAQEIAASGLAANDWVKQGSTVSVMGFGPYNLAPGDSIHIVIAAGVAGLSREKNREVGGNWLQYYKGIGTPTLIMPDGSTTTNHTEYKKAWVLTCRDSLTQTFRRAIENYNSGYRIPQPPPPPEKFIIQSGGDRIRLSWANNATSWPNFDGYVIYRSEGTVMAPKTVYKKVFECDKAHLVHTWDDTTAVRGFDYYYYIQSKDDGSTNNGKPLVSSMFWTLTSKPAHLRRPAGTLLCQVRVVPNPYDIRARVWQFGDKYQYDRIAFYGLPPFCKLKIFTERGDLIWEIDHTNGAGDELWDSMTSSRQIVVSGIYILYVEVLKDTYAEEDAYAWHDIYDDNGKLMYRKGDLLYRRGELIYHKGDSIYRKFVIIR
ncbi:MAG: hypothetical protein ONB05_05040 [candidate division KSB1 bacterium]|nr:hypothetical protein [candidate division KSB1 bacterium]